MAWRIWGDGPPLVLGHGAQGAWSHWIRNIDVLASHRQVIALDLPGHGDSALPAGGDHAAFCVALAEGLRRVVGERLPVDMVGFSFSGILFAYLATFNPELVRRVILVGCGGLDTPLGEVDLRGLRGLEGEARRAAIKANLLGLMLHDPDSVDELAMYLQVYNGRRARFAPVAELVLPDKLLGALAAATVPIDAIWGEFDRPHPAPDLQEAAIRRFQPDTDFRDVAGAGHWAMYERPEAFDRTLLAMLQRPARSVS